MTIRDYLHTMLVYEVGMMPNQADEVIASLETDPNASDWKDRLKDEATGYPPPFVAAVRLTTKRAALKWVDKNLPLAWYRPILTGEV